MADPKYPKAAGAQGGAGDPEAKFLGSNPGVLLGHSDMSPDAVTGREKGDNPGTSENTAYGDIGRGIP